MEEKKEYNISEEESGKVQPGMEEPESIPVEPVETADLEFLRECDTTYRGIGTGRRESPFADSPYVMNHHPRDEEPSRPLYREHEMDPDLDFEEDFLPVEPVRPRGRVLKKILAWAAALAVVAGSCAFTAHTVNEKWEARMDAMESDFMGKLGALERAVYELTPAHTGNSVSGTVAVGDAMTAAQVYAKNVQSVVRIEATVTTELYGQTTTGTSTGSGFILTEDGYVVTNFHVVEGASSVSVGLHNGTSYPAALVGYDSTNDLAVLKIQAQGLDPVALGSSNALIVGDQVVAIGNPLGELTSTLTVGYVSAKERTINTDGTILNMIQTDAAINSGNSGGPLFNMKGQVVGITTAKYSGSSSSGASIEGIGFAIPLDDVLEEIHELIQFGYIKSAYLGVLVQNLDPAVADIYGLPVGAYVAGVEDGYCAKEAGLRAKDIIIAVGDVEIGNINDLTRALRKYEPGDKAKIVVYRGGQVMEFTVILDERPASAG